MSDHEEPQELCADSSSPDQSPSPVPTTERPEEAPDKDKEEEDEEERKRKAKEKKEERMRKLRELHMRRNEARKLNHAELVEEDKRNKLPANWEARKRKIEWELADEEAKKRAEEAGEDYERVKLLEMSASDMERLERKKKRKNPDTGFADYQQAQLRQYHRLTRQIEPDMKAYEKKREELGDDFYPGAHSLISGGSGKVSKQGMDRMVKDLEKQIEKRSKFSRRREFHHEADVDYINERNMKFNLKAARYYDKYTAEIKQNFERGTAV